HPLTLRAAEHISDILGRAAGSVHLQPQSAQQRLSCGRPASCSNKAERAIGCDTANRRKLGNGGSVQPAEERMHLLHSISCPRLRSSLYPDHHRLRSHQLFVPGFRETRIAAVLDNSTSAEPHRHRVAAINGSLPSSPSNSCQTASPPHPAVPQTLPHPPRPTSPAPTTQQP